MGIFSKETGCANNNIPVSWLVMAGSPKSRYHTVRRHLSPLPFERLPYYILHLMSCQFLVANRLTQHLRVRILALSPSLHISIQSCLEPSDAAGDVSSIYSTPNASNALALGLFSFTLILSTGTYISIFFSVPC